MSKQPKTALITGAARRVGAEIATLLHASGINVILHYNHSAAEAKQLCDELNQKRDHSATLLQAELTDLSACTSLIQQSALAWGTLDIVVNNASRFYQTALGHVSEDQWNDLINSNLKAPYFLCQAAAPYLTEQQGCIVNIADVHADKPMRHYSAYCISKAGLIMLTKALAQELGPKVRVNAVAPGVVALPEGENTLSPELQQKIIQKTALQRHGMPSDIAKAVLFLVSNGDFITGQVITVDGGRSLSM